MLLVNKDYPTTVTIDGHVIPLRIARMTLFEYEPFSRAFLRYTAKDAKPEMLEGREPTQAEQDAFDDARLRWLRDVLDRYVTVEPGSVQAHDGAGTYAAVTNAAVLADLFGGRRDVFLAIVQAVWVENTLTPDQKKGLRSQPGSTPGSEPTKGDAATGAPSGSTADAAEPKDSGTPEAAPAGGA